MMTLKKEIRLLAIALTIFPFTLLLPEVIYSSNGVVCAAESFTTGRSHHSNFKVLVDSGADWRNITVKINSYICGETPINSISASWLQGKNIINKRLNLIHSQSETAASKLMTAIAEKVAKAGSQAFTNGRNPVVTMNYLIKITGIITFHVRNISGENSISVTKGITTKCYYYLKLNGKNISNKVYFFQVS